MDGRMRQMIVLKTTVRQEKSYLAQRTQNLPHLKAMKKQEERQDGAGEWSRKEREKQR